MRADEEGAKSRVGVRVRSMKCRILVEDWWMLSDGLYRTLTCEFSLKGRTKVALMIWKVHKVDNFDENQFLRNLQRRASRVVL